MTEQFSNTSNSQQRNTTKFDLDKKESSLTLRKSASLSYLVVQFDNLSTENLNIFYKKTEILQSDLPDAPSSAPLSRKLKAPSTVQLQQQQSYTNILNAAKKFEEILGSELCSKLICDNTNSLILFSQKKMTSTVSTDRNSIESNENSLSDFSKSSSSSISPNITASNGHDVHILENASELLDKKKRQKLDEYYHIEEKQAKLLKILAKSV